MDELIRRRRRISVQRKIFLDRENPFDCGDIFFHRYRFTKETASFLIDEENDDLRRSTKRSKAIPSYLIVRIHELCN